MFRIALVSLSSLLVVGCAGPRSLLLPISKDTAPTVATIEMGAKSSRKVFDFEIPSVDATVNKGKGFSVKLPFGTFGRTTYEKKHNFVVTRQGSLLFDVKCNAKQEPHRIASNWFYKHLFSCAGEGFELTMEERIPQDFKGQVKVGGLALELVSTDALTTGTGWAPAGFHVRRDGRWLGSVEYFTDGKVYLAPDLSEDERQAVLVAMVSLSSTGKWFATNPDGTVGKRSSL